MSWKKGPLPPKTYMWGGVVPVGQEGSGFYFADFCGDHVKIWGAVNEQPKVLQAHEVAWYDNSLELPPSSPKGARLGEPA